MEREREREKRVLVSTVVAINIINHLSGDACVSLLVHASMLRGNGRGRGTWCLREFRCVLI